MKNTKNYLNLRNNILDKTNILLTQNGHYLINVQNYVSFFINKNLEFIKKSDENEYSFLEYKTGKMDILFIFQNRIRINQLIDCLDKKTIELFKDNTIDEIKEIENYDSNDYSLTI